MFNQRLRQLRVARGLSLEALSAQIGGIVSRQALLKYEQGKMKPSSIVMSKLASALNVKAMDLLREPIVRAEFVGYRSKSRLSKRERDRIQNLVSHELEQRFRLQELSGWIDGSNLPVRALAIKTVDDVEQAAESLRTKWGLGQNPIANVTDLLEDHLIHVLQINADESFDGLAAVAYDGKRHVKSAAIITRRGIPGDRQRFNYCHELGHLVLQISNKVDEEKAAHRFGSAFLIPAAAIRREVGNHRGNIRMGELLLLKQHFGLSIQALLHRMKDLKIITDSYYRSWCIEINRRGWKKSEPEPLNSEEPKWLDQNAMRAVSEGWLTKSDAEAMLGKSIEIEEPLSLTKRRAFAKLPIAERRKMLKEQAAKMRDHYASMDLED